MGLDSLSKSAPLESNKSHVRNMLESCDNHARSEKSNEKGSVVMMRGHKRPTRWSKPLHRLDAEERQLSLFGQGGT